MVNKAQKALDDISNMLYTTDYVEHIRCHTYPIMEEEQAALQQLIDCQIKYESLRMARTVLEGNLYSLEKKARMFSREGKFSDLAVYTSIINEHKRIIDDLKKQEKMWEEEENE